MWLERWGSAIRDTVDRHMLESINARIVAIVAFTQLDKAKKNLEFYNWTMLAVARKASLKGIFRRSYTRVVC